MSYEAAEHAAWRSLVEAQSPTGDLGDVAASVRELIERSGGPMYAVLGLQTAAGRLLGALAEATGQDPRALAERFRDDNAIEYLQMDLEDGEGDADDD